MKIKEYYIINILSGVGSLETYVSSKIKEGWQPFGTSYSHDGALCQAMVKYEGESSPEDDGWEKTPFGSIQGGKLVQGLRLKPTKEDEKSIVGGKPGQVLGWKYNVGHVWIDENKITEIEKNIPVSDWKPTKEDEKKINEALKRCKENPITESKNKTINLPVRSLEEMRIHVNLNESVDVIVPKSEPWLDWKVCSEDNLPENNNQVIVKIKNDSIKSLLFFRDGIFYKRNAEVILRDLIVEWAYIPE